MATSPEKHDVAFLIIPGSFCTPPIYDPLINLLRAQGHEADVIPLLSANDGTRQPPATTADDAAHIRQAILARLDNPARPRDVVLAAHSYGGIPTSSALQGLGRADRASREEDAGGRERARRPTAVVGIAYAAAFVLPADGKGGNRAFMRAAGALDEVPEVVRFGRPGTYMPLSLLLGDESEGEGAGAARARADTASSLFGDLAPAEAARVAGLMTGQSSDSYEGGVMYEAWRDIPSVMLIPDGDTIIPTPLLEGMYERAVAGGGGMRRVLVEGAGHMLPVGKPEVVVAELVRLAEDR